MGFESCRFTTRSECFCGELFGVVFLPVKICSLMVLCAQVLALSVIITWKMNDIVF